MAWLPGVGDGAALVVVSNVAAFVATALLYILVRRETGDRLVARRAIWFLSLAPAAYVLVMGYAESTFLCLADRLLPGAPRRRPRPSHGATEPGPPGSFVGQPPNFVLAGVLAFLAALTRPIGVLLALAVAVELVRWWTRLGRSRRLAGLGATAAPLVGLAAFGLWSHHEVGDFWAPLSVQFQSSHHGALADPLVTAYHDVRGLWHGHVGTALHVPWVVLALFLLVVCWRKLPRPTPSSRRRSCSWRVAGANLDSFERYALSAFPLTIAAALICGKPIIERVGPGAAPRRTGRVRAAGVLEHLGAVRAHPRAGRHRAGILLTAN